MTLDDKTIATQYNKLLKETSDNNLEIFDKEGNTNFINLFKFFARQKEKISTFDIDSADPNVKYMYLVFHKDRFFTMLKELFKIKKNKNILDIGTSDFTILLRLLLRDSEIYTIDKTENWKNIVSNYKIRFKKTDLTKDIIPYKDNYFDLVILSEVIEHLSTNPKIIFEKIYRILRKNGILIVTTPNFATLRNRIKLFFGKNIQQTIPIEKSKSYHFKEYTKKEIEEMLKSSKFKKIKISYHTYWDSLTSFFASENFSLNQKILFFPIAVIYIVIVKLVPPLRHGMVFITKK